jgi:hypothetical protein
MTNDLWSAYGEWVTQCDTTQVMAMDLLRGVRHLGPQ